MKTMSKAKTNNLIKHLTAKKSKRLSRSIANRSQADKLERLSIGSAKKNASVGKKQETGFEITLPKLNVETPGYDSE